MMGSEISYSKQSKQNNKANFVIHNLLWPIDILNGGGDGTRIPVSADQSPPVLRTGVQEPEPVVCTLNLG